MLVVVCCLCRYRGIPQLAAMLQHAGHVTDVLYYEVLDMPLPQLEQLKSLRVRACFACDCRYAS